MAIILEGADAVGKTTIARRLQQQLDWKIIKGSSFGLTSNHTNEELFDHFKEITICAKNIIIDRWAISNYLYAPKYHDYAHINDDQLRYLFSLLEKYDITLVYVKADLKTVKKRYEKRGDEYLKWNDIKYFHKRYEEFFTQLKTQRVKFVEVDTSYNITTDIINFLISIA